MAESRHPRDPRVVFDGQHRERGEAKFSYTYSDIAKIAGLSKKTIQNAASKGELDPASLASVLEFIEARRLRSRRRAANHRV